MSCTDQESGSIERNSDRFPFWQQLHHPQAPHPNDSLFSSMVHMPLARAILGRGMFSQIDCPSVMSIKKHYIQSENSAGFVCFAKLCVLECMSASDCMRRYEDDDDLGQKLSNIGYADVAINSNISLTDKWCVTEVAAGPGLVEPAQPDEHVSLLPPFQSSSIGVCCARKVARAATIQQPNDIYYLGPNVDKELVQVKAQQTRGMSNGQCSFFRFRTFPENQ